MTSQTITLNLPAKLYRSVKQRAHTLNRSIEDEIVAAVETGLTTIEDLAGIPEDIANEVSQLAFLDDDHLWRAARTAVPPEKSRRMQELVLQMQAEGLTEVEQQEAEHLRHFANRVMLIRAEAAVLLQQRGFDISTLPQQNPE